MNPLSPLRNITNRSRDHCRIFLELINKNQKMSTCKQLDLET